MWRLVLILLVFVNSHRGCAGENDLYDFLWLDPDKSVYVLQNKLYPKRNRLYFNIGYIMGLSSTFVDTSGVQLRMGYYLSEEWALEYGHYEYSHQNNSAYDSVKAINGAEPFSRRFVKQDAIFLRWSPFYGKINTFNEIYYFDWSFSVGTSALSAKSNLDSVRTPSSGNTFDSEYYNPLLLKTNIKFHLNKRTHLEVEYLNTNFESNSPSNPGAYEWDNRNDLSISLGVSF